jgi:D-arginine dehydrogenase
LSDFLVIGGGIAGLAAGAALSELGRVTVLEGEDQLGYHTSGRSAALYEENYGAPSVIALNRASLPVLRERGVLSPRGLLLVALKGQEAAYADDMAGMGLHDISPDEMMAKVPVLRRDQLIGGGFHDGAYDIDTDALLQGFARDIRARGGAVITRAKVSAIRRVPTGWVVSAGADYEVPVLVNAAGSWADQVAEMAGLPPIGLQPYRRSMARVPVPDGHDAKGWPMMFGAGEEWYAKPDAGALIVSPSEEHPMEPHDAWPEDEVLAEGIARYEEAVDAPVTRLLAKWAGLRTFARDRTLVLGPDPLDTSFVWSAGQGGYGFQTAPGAARLVADLVGGRASELSAGDVAALRPDRLR